MAIKISKKRVSTTQRGLLKSAKERLTSATAIEALLQVCYDSDITSGSETVHPDWAEIFVANSRRLRSYLEADKFVELERLFDQSEPYDLEVLKIDLATSRVAFLLGAGASKPNPSDIPTVTELLPDLLQRARRLNRQDLDRLADFCEESKIQNIEDLLTAAQLSEFCSRNPAVLRLIEFLIYRKEPEESGSSYLSARSRRRHGSVSDLSAVAFLQDTLQVLFGLLSSRMLPAKPNAAHKAIADYVQKNKSTSILTTNYDCCMDLALGTERVNFSYLVDFANRKPARKAASLRCSLIKLHGSLNWFYCDTCQQVHLIDIKKTVKDYIADQGCYSVIAVCKDCGGQRRGLLVPPLAMKFDLAPPLTPLIERAQEAFNHAQVIVVVGFSFAEADLYISRMLTKALQTSKGVKVIVFDPDSGVVDKLRRQLSLRIPGFDSERILRVKGDCSQTLPAFLTGKLKSLEIKKQRFPKKKASAKDKKIKKNKGKK